MKHSIKITAILLGMFIITQLIGLAVIQAYKPVVKIQISENGTITNQTVYDLPYGTAPPPELEPKYSLMSIIIAFVIAISLIILLMKIRAEIFLRIWFFVVITLALGVTANAVLKYYLTNSSIIALVIALPLSYLKVFKRDIFVHNFTELLIYPGIAAIFVPLMSIWTIVILLILISIYDIWAVWHSGIMQRMAKYQIKEVKVFSGFFIPYLGKKEKELIQQAKIAQAKASKTQMKKMKEKNIKVNVAILGGGDVVFPIIIAGVALWTLGLLPALFIVFGATLALAILFIFSQKGKFYPAMPFISAGCFLGLLLAQLL